MGDPRRLRNAYERPKKLWDKDRLEEEKGLRDGYGLKNMRELWRATAELKKYRREARRLLSITAEERKEGSKVLLKKMARLSLLREGAEVDEVLSLEVKSVLERRLQTMVLRAGLARSFAQSRQLITHGFVKVNGRVVTKPGYLVRTEDQVSYAKSIDINIKEAPKAQETKAPETKAAA